MLNMRARTDQEHAERVCSAPNRTRGVVASPLALLQVVNELPELSHQPAVDNLHTTCVQFSSVVLALVIHQCTPARDRVDLAERR
jgi:hypothetical protein